MSVAGDGFDRERAIFPETVLPFVRETQPKEWTKLEALHGDRTGEQKDSARRTPRVALAAGAVDRTAATGSGGLRPTGPVGPSDPADHSTRAASTSIAPTVPIDAVPLSESPLHCVPSGGFLGDQIVSHTTIWPPSAAK